ncbi:MAG: glycosyltransferase family 39 protein [Victivallales bacterium]|nr:glycosyltransferase family 39 protein [Victivallales bacterium]
MSIRLNKYFKIALIISVFLTIFTLWFHGPRTCSDATGYIMGAITLKYSHSYLWQASDAQLQTEGFAYEYTCPKNSLDLNEYKRDKAQGYQTHWAIGYPLLTFIAGKMTGLNVKYSFCLVNTISIIATLLCTWFFIRSNNVSIDNVGRLLFLIIFSSYLWLISMVAFSEVPFLPISIWMLYELDLYIRKKNLKYLWVSMLLCGFCILLRYAGLYLIMAAFMSILIKSPEDDEFCKYPDVGKNYVLRKQILLSCVYFWVSIIPFGFWQLRNYLLTGGLRGTKIAESDLIGRFWELLKLPAAIFFPLPPQLANINLLFSTFLFIRHIVSYFIISYIIWQQLSIRTPQRKGMPLLYSSFSYLIFICISSLLTGEPYPLDFRIMLPFIFPLGMYCIINTHSKSLLSIPIQKTIHILLYTSLIWTYSYLILFLGKNIKCALFYH